MTAPDPARESSQAVPRSLSLSIDRTLGIPVGAQLRGQLEYGIACGEIERGARLPSVRELAQELRLAHMTVVQVYKELLSLGLIVTHPGRGTFVANAPQPGAQNLEPLRKLLTQTLEQAAGAGYSPRQVGEVLNMLLARGGRPARDGGRGGVDVLLIGLFEGATRAYAQTLQAALPGTDQVRSITLEEVRSGDGQAQARAADVVLALAHRLAETSALLPGVSIIPVNFIPSEATRQALAALDPMSKLAVVATFEEFLPTFLAGVKRFAPLVSDLWGSSIQSPDLSALLGWADVVVYATGSEMICELAGDTPCTEYRHTIDPRDIERLVLPAVEACRELG
jgi:DNA-binding transcriptional regulator YhcF (GntR family)